MKIIGITGGIGCGKSRVLAYLSEHFPAKVCQADHVAWKLQEPGQDCYQKIVTYFGKNVLNKDKTINRQRLSQIVFTDETALQRLNEIMHPAVKKAIITMIQSEKEKGTEYFFLEAALLLEENYGQICDELWYIYTDEQTRRQRLAESRQYSKEKMDAIIASQLGEEEFRKSCHIVIDNSGDFADTCEQIEEAMK